MIDSLLSALSFLALRHSDVVASQGDIGGADALHKKPHATMRGPTEGEAEVKEGADKEAAQRPEGVVDAGVGTVGTRQAVSIGPPQT